MSLVGKTIKYNTENGLQQGVVVDKVIGYYSPDKFAHTRYLVEHPFDGTITIVPYHKVYCIIKQREIPNVPESDRVNLNNKLPGIIPKSSWPKIAKNPE